MSRGGSRARARRVSRRPHPRARERRRAHRGLRRSGRVVRRDGATDALGGAVRAVRRPRHAARRGQARLPDPRLRRRVGAEPVHACRRCSAVRAISICAARTPARPRGSGSRSSSTIPELELEAGALTLREIQDRAAAFDPLTLELDHDVRAISRNAWFSLGRHGVGLALRAGDERDQQRSPCSRGARGKRWEVTRRRPR